MSEKASLMTLAEIARESGISRRTFERHPEILRGLLAKAPIGRRKYARVLVERWLNDESVTRIGKGARVSA